MAFVRHQNFKLRTRRYGGRALQTCLIRPPLHPCVFFHMPKCGGTSLSEALYATIPLHKRIGVIDALSTRRAAAIKVFGKDDRDLCHEDKSHGAATFDLRQSMLLQHMAWQTSMIHGHVLWSDLAMQHFGARYKFVTVLRDPTDRVLSNFQMAQRTGAFKASFDEYLESDFGRNQAQVFLRYFGGKPSISETETSDVLKKAKSNLMQFSLIGFLDKLDQFCDDYKRLFGTKPRPQRLNKATQEHLSLSKAQRLNLEKLCAADQEIYEVARAIR